MGNSIPIVLWVGQKFASNAIEYLVLPTIVWLLRRIYVANIRKLQQFYYNVLNDYLK